MNYKPLLGKGLLVVPKDNGFKSHPADQFVNMDRTSVGEPIAIPVAKNIRMGYDTVHQFNGLYSVKF